MLADTLDSLALLSADEAVVAAALLFDLPGLRARLTELPLGNAVAVIGVDTGLTHLANALPVPLVAIYIDTDPQLTGVIPTPRARNLGGIGQCPDVDAVWQALQECMA